MWLPKLERFNQTSLEYLEKKYRKILRKRYGVPKEALASAADFSAVLHRVRQFSSPIEMDQDAIRTGTKPLIYNQFWNQLLSDAMASIPPESGMHVSTILIGEVPDYSFDSVTENCGKHRHLILIQRGLTTFIMRVMRLIIGSALLKVKIPDWEERLIEPVLDMETARASVRRNLELLFKGKHEREVHISSNPHLVLISDYTYAMEQFVIGHELGHVSQSLNVHKFVDWGPMPEAPREWIDELLADRFAAHVGQWLVDTVEKRPRIVGDARSIFFEAPYVLFGLMQALDRYAVDHGIRGGDTHPPAALRKESLLSYQRATGVPEDWLASAEMRWQHITDLTKATPLTESGIEQEIPVMYLDVKNRELPSTTFVGFHMPARS